MESTPNMTTNFQGKPFNDILRMVVIVTGTVALAIGLLGTSLLLLVMWRQRNVRGLHNTFIVNLGVADLMVLSILPFFLLDLLLSGQHPVLNDQHCRVNGFVLSLGYSVSIVNLILISFNRYVKVCRRALFPVLFSARRNVAVCTVVWLGAALLCSPFFFIQSFKPFDPRSHLCNARGDSVQPQYGSVLMAAFLLTPLVLIVFFNIAIFHHWRLSQGKVQKRRRPKREGAVPTWRSFLSKSMIDLSMGEDTAMAEESEEKEAESCSDEPTKESEEKEAESCSAEPNKESEEKEAESCSAEPTKESMSSSRTAPPVEDLPEDVNTDNCAQSSQNMFKARCDVSPDANSISFGSVYPTSHMFRPKSEHVRRNSQIAQTTRMMMSKKKQAKTVRGLPGAAARWDVCTRALDRNNQPIVFADSTNIKSFFQADFFGDYPRFSINEEGGIAINCENNTGDSLSACQIPDCVCDLQSSCDACVNSSSAEDRGRHIREASSKWELYPSIERNSQRSKRRQITEGGKRHGRSFENRRRSAGGNNTNDAALARSLLVISACLFFLYTPFLLTLILTFVFQDLVPVELQVACTLPLFVNSAVNWIIYGVMNTVFRQAYVSTLMSLSSCCRTSSQRVRASVVCTVHPRMSGVTWETASI